MAAVLTATRGHVDTPYDEGVVRLFVMATMFWGVAGFLVGTYIAFQLAYPVLNWDLEWTSFGRLRPIHTSAVIFAFGGNARSTWSSAPAGYRCSADRCSRASSSGATRSSSCWPPPAT
jgi:cbb3-type cytochrome oxidase subunit 1